MLDQPVILKKCANSDKSRAFVLLAMGKFYNGTLKAKSTFCGVESNSMLMHTRLTAPRMFVKFGWHTQTCCHKKKEEAVAKLQSDRL